uniref:non-specific serine/threonine protein kinase n=1 Tax=Anopheles farauti TaxID=69004 RepID=A0A182QQ95_9DIPT
MGNQLVALAPSQIFPVEHYLTGTLEFELQFEKSMGSTRFMKVAKVKVDEGPAVVKVFVRHDPSLPLEQHLERIEYIKKHLANAVNCLPFQKVLTMEKSCLIVRQYVKHSLYDRVSTRPFLTLIEKKWITFQILCALHQCHKQKICHGDIKLENILITSWNWVLLSDFASFKPTYLPEDNPADYSYFFDTSRRRTCYIAPERFVRSSSGESLQPKDGPLVGDGQYYAGQLLPEMDIFSAGCALLELWTEGTAPFEFSQLLAYRRGEVDMVRKHLDGIGNERLRDLVESMLSLEPRERKSAELYLDQERGKLFPEYFYAFLQSYLQMFSTVPVVPPDEKVARLHGDIGQIIKILTGSDGSQPGQPKAGGEKREEKEEEEDEDNDGLILITSVVTACIRGLSFCRSKLLALEILQSLAENTTAETILDRILPYILHLAQDAAPRVRVCSLNTLTRCLRMVRKLPRTDANVFPEYILPAIAPLATDSSAFVRMTYARNIATLADTAVSFLEQSQQSCTTENLPPPHYETELSALHEMLHQTVLSLLTDAQSAVKQTLMTSGITQLCVFFGRQKANDVILSHMITFLNDKEDRHLRGAFFDCIVGVASYVGWHCAPMLLPLLQQGLTDPEEFVIAKAIHATTMLIELGLIQKQGTIEFIGECACYLAHPNLWIRHEVVELVATAARILTAIDVQCKVRPSLAPHLRFPLIEITCPELLLDCLLPPVPRNIYDAVLRFGPDITPLLEVLRDRRTARTRAQAGDPTTMTATTATTAPTVRSEQQAPLAIQQLLRRLTTDGLTEPIEEQLLTMAAHLVKLHRYKLAETRQPHHHLAAGRIVLDHYPDVMGEIPLAKAGHSARAGGEGGAAGELGKGSARGASRKSESDSAQDWQHMLGAIDSHSPSPTAATIVITTGSNTPTTTTPTGSELTAAMLPAPLVAATGASVPMAAAAALPQPQPQPQPPAAPPASVQLTSQPPAPVPPPTSSSLVEYSLPERTSGQQERLSDCRLEMEALVAKLRTRFATYQRQRELRESNTATPPLPAGWRLNGTLVAHLAEHKAAVSRMAALKPHTGSMFASASIDGTVRLWDCSKLDGQQSVNRSRQSYHANTPLHAVAACDAGQSLAVAGKDGTLLLLKIDTNSSKMALQQARHFEADTRYASTGEASGAPDDGPVVEMAPLDQGAQSVIVYATLYGALVGWDIRMPDYAWRLQSDLRSGVITTFCIDPSSSWLTVGTSSGRHVCWDLRFQLPIAKINHPHDARIRRVSHHPTESSWLVSASQGNSEVYVWNIETGHRQQAYWASASPPLSNSAASSHSVCALLPGVHDGNPFLLTGGTDQRLRYWDPVNVENCALVVPSARDYAPLNVTYDGGEQRGGRPADDTDHRVGPEMPAHGHNDVISDLLMCRTAKQTFIASSSRDGVIKLWK